MKLAVIGTFYERHENAFALFTRLFVDTTHEPDEVWLMCESEADKQSLVDAYRALYELEVLDCWPGNARIHVLPTAKDDYGHYEVIPYSNKINWALDRTEADVVCYLDNGSMPDAEKYGRMLEWLEVNELAAVYCSQLRTGWNKELSEAVELVPDAFCRLNYTQVMHRLTDDRWPLDMALASPDLADATFWRLLHQSLGPFYPVPSSRPLDVHHMESPTAVGLEV